MQNSNIYCQFKKPNLKYKIRIYSKINTNDKKNKINEMKKKGIKLII